MEAAAYKVGLRDLSKLGSYLEVTCRQYVCSSGDTGKVLLTFEVRLTSTMKVVLSTRCLPDSVFPDWSFASSLENE